MASKSRHLVSHEVLPRRRSSLEVLVRDKVHRDAPERCSVMLGHPKLGIGK